MPQSSEKKQHRLWTKAQQTVVTLPCLEVKYRIQDKKIMRRPMFVPGYFPPTSIPTAFLLSSTENIGACDRPCSKVRTPSSAWNFWPWCNTWAPCDRQTLLGGMIIVVDWHTRLSCMVLSWCYHVLFLEQTVLFLFRLFHGCFPHFP